MMDRFSSLANELEAKSKQGEQLLRLATNASHVANRYHAVGATGSSEDLRRGLRKRFKRR